MSAHDTIGSWAVAIMAVVVGVILVVMAVWTAESEANRHDEYRKSVELCATTADNQREFKACVGAAR